MQILVQLDAGLRPAESMNLEVSGFLGVRGEEVMGGGVRLC